MDKSLSLILWLEKQKTDPRTFIQRFSLDIAATPMPARILDFRAVSSTDVVYVWRMNAITVWIACATARSAIEIGGTR